ncbi:methyl-accepting chemotaxis protein [candidate division KSB1 bacterium]
MKLKIKRVIFFGYFLIIFFMVLWFIYFSGENTQGVRTMSENIQTFISADNEVKSIQLYDLGEIDSKHHEFLKNPDQNRLLELENSLQKMQSKIINIKGSIPTQGGEHLNKIIGLLGSALETYKAFPVEQQKINGGRLIDLYIDLDNILNTISLEFEAVHSVLSQELLQAEVQNIPAKLRENDMLAFAYFFGITLISIILGFFFATKISSRIQNISARLFSASKNILDTARNEEINFSDRSESVDQTASTLENLSQTSNDMAVNAGNVFKQMENSADTIVGLRQKTNQINSISSTIEDITAQINILSLNASIEASRAGEQGKGFSAVAIEIRKLAENTRGFTDDIAVIIKEIQDSINKMVDFSSQAVKQIKSISSSVITQSDSIHEINTSVSEVNTNMKNSAERMRETVLSSKDLLELSKQMNELI